MKLSLLIENVKVKSIKGSLDRDIKYILQNSKEVAENSLFVAVQGTRFDGHNFVGEAVGNGAVCVVLEKDLKLDDNITKILVEDTKEALGEIWSNFYSKPSFSLKTVGVTGTNGKTTITYLCKNIFEKSGYKTGILGTIKNLIGDKTISGNLTTMPPSDFHKYLHYAVENGIGYVFCEVSSHGLAQKRIHGAKFDVCVFTNLTHEHLDFHKDMEDYFHAKLRLFTDYGKDNFTSVVNIDDEYGKRIRDILIKEKHNLITYAVKNDADVKATNINILPEGNSFDVSVMGKKISLKMKLVGKFNVYNSLAVIGVGISQNIDLMDIKCALDEAMPVRGRMERVGDGLDYYIYVDYAHTPDGLREILLSSREFCKSRVLLVFGCGGDRDKAKRKIMGKIAANFSDYTIITSDNPRSEEPEAIAKEIETGFLEEKRTNYEIVIDRYSAIKKALSYAKKNDVVIIAGKGHEDYQIFKDKTIHFDDKEVVEEIIKKWK